MAIPKESVRAAYPENLRIGDVVIRPLTLQHIFALQRLDHVLLRAAKKDKAGKVIPQEISMEDQLLAMVIMSMTPEAIAEELANGADRAKMLKAAYLAASRIPFQEIGKLVMSLQEQMRRGFETFVPMAREGDGTDVPLA
jgi:hypothetical protein